MDVKERMEESGGATGESRGDAPALRGDDKLPNVLERLHNVGRLHKEEEMEEKEEEEEERRLYCKTWSSFN